MLPESAVEPLIVTAEDIRQSRHAVLSFALQAQSNKRQDGK
jgi:hypothetical protein